MTFPLVFFLLLFALLGAMLPHPFGYFMAALALFLLLETLYG